MTIPPNVNPQLKNVAAVTVTADLPPFSKPGQTIDVTVASIGNAGSLRGGALLMTPLRGADGEVYAMAQGSLVVSGFGVSGKDGSRVSVNVPSGGRMPNGATVEREVPNNFARGQYRDAEPEHTGFHDRDAPGRRHQQAAGRGHGHGRSTRSACKVAAPADRTAAHRFVSALQEMDIEPGEAPARVIINSRTGTVVIGSRVRVTPAAVVARLAVGDHQGTPGRQPAERAFQGRDGGDARTPRSRSTSRRRACSCSTPASTWTRSCAR